MESRDGANGLVDSSFELRVSEAVGGRRTPLDQAIRALRAIDRVIAEIRDEVPTTSDRRAASTTQSATMDVLFEHRLRILAVIEDFQEKARAQLAARRN